MTGPGPANDEERLPWLEPYRDSAKARPRPVPVAKPAGSKRGAMVAGGVAAVVAALTAGYWIGQRDIRPATPPTEIAEVPVTEAPTAPPTVAPAEPVDEQPATAETAAPRKAAVVAPRKVARKIVRQRKIRSAGIESDQIRAVRAAQERRAAPPPVPTVTVYRAWPKMPSPGPAGQVIQLGAFRDPSGANRAYRNRLARYPLLGRMPRVVVPVITRPRGQILYVLRLGTTSRQQSAIVCRNLRASGDHCLVIG